MDPVEAQNAMLTMAVGSELKIVKKEKYLNKVCKVDRGAVGVGPIGAQTLAETWSLHCY